MFDNDSLWKELEYILEGIEEEKIRKLMNETFIPIYTRS